MKRVGAIARHKSDKILCNYVIHVYIVNGRIYASNVILKHIKLSVTRNYNDKAYTSPQLFCQFSSFAFLLNVSFEMKKPSKF